MRFVRRCIFRILIRRFPSSTCKRLAEVCAIVLFHSLRLNEIDSEFHRRLSDTIEKVGPFVRDLTLSVDDRTDDEEDQPTHDVLSQLPNVRCLTVIHEREDVADHSPLHQLVPRFSHLEEVTFYEDDYWPGWSLPHPHAALPSPHARLTSTFFHRFLHTILKVHGNHLRGLHIYTVLLLDKEIYLKIRDNTPNLRSITFTANIGSSLHGLFTDSTPWVSGSLDQIRLQSCRGVHMGHFARDLLAGVYGTSLKEVSVIACGPHDYEDTPYIPPVGTPARASINRLRIDHFVMWGLSAMSFIPVRDLSLTQICPQSFVELPILLEKRSPDPGGVYLAFPGLEQLRLSPKLASQEKVARLDNTILNAFQDLKGVCLRRGVALSLDADEHLISYGIDLVG